MHMLEQPCLQWIAARCGLWDAVCTSCACSSMPFLPTTSSGSSPGSAHDESQRALPSRGGLCTRSSATSMSRRLQLSNNVQSTAESGLSSAISTFVTLGHCEADPRALHSAAQHADSAGQPRCIKSTPPHLSPVYLIQRAVADLLLTEHPVPTSVWTELFISSQS